MKLRYPHARLQLFLITVVVAASCGGGGGAGNTPPVTPPPPPPAAEQFADISTASGISFSVEYTQNPGDVQDVTHFAGGVAVGDYDSDGVNQIDLGAYEKAPANSLPPQITGLVFDGDTLSWDPATFAVSYNVYRGTVTGAGLTGLTCATPSDPDPTDLVFVDILMREKDGVRFLREMRALDRHRKTEVVIVTSKDYDQDRALARQWGANEYLLKPLRSQEIREIIQRHTAARETGADPQAR